MNEFTKEELQIIQLDMCTYAARYKMPKESPSHAALRNKVESMIDNYCEHTYGMFFEESNARPFCKMCREPV